MIANGGLGACSATDPSGCTGPYSNPMFNFDYQNQLANAGGSVDSSGNVQAQPQLMSYYDLLNQAYSQAGLNANCSPLDTTCVANKVAIQAAVENFWVANKMTVPVGTSISLPPLTQAQVVAYRPPNVLTQQSVITNLPVTSKYVAPVTTPLNQISNTSSGGSSKAMFNFATSRSGGYLYPGDTWTISITGAQPNSPVTTSGVDPGHSFSNQAFGQTDGAGNWSLSGTIDPSLVGGWTENWMVGGQSVGVISFTVLAGQPTTQSQSTANQTGASTTTNLTNTVAPSSPSTVPSIFDLFGDTSTPIMIGTGFGIGEYTALGLVAVLALGMMAMGSHRGR